MSLSQPFSPSRASNENSAARQNREIRWFGEIRVVNLVAFLHPANSIGFELGSSRRSRDARRSPRFAIIDGPDRLATPCKLIIDSSVSDDDTDRRAVESGTYTRRDARRQGKYSQRAALSAASTP